MKEQRLEQILALLNSEKYLRLSDLMKTLNSTESTVRRDLNTLESQGFVQRVHGGVKLIASNIGEEDFSVIGK